MNFRFLYSVVTLSAFFQVAVAQDKPKPLVVLFTETQAKKARAEWAKYLKIPKPNRLI
jgi:hypothetical protein